MITILLVETDPDLDETVHDIEAMCHEAEIGILIHHEGESLSELLDSAESPIIAFSPKGKLTLDEMVKKYSDNALLVVGGFTEHKDLPREVYHRAADTVSLGREFLPIADVIQRIIDAHKR
jgi:rRNA pseudouridine-1189 N-methylase Emg1 (Nep1/Mra1 family)